MLQTKSTKRKINYLSGSKPIKPIYKKMIVDVTKDIHTS